MSSRRTSREVRAALEAVRPGLQGIASRLADGEEKFLEVLMRQGDLSREDAVFAFREMRRCKAVKRVNGLGGEWRVVHGALLEPDVVRRAAELGRKKG